MTAAWPHGDPAAVARAVVAEPRFRHGGDEAIPTLLERMLQWLGDRLNDVFGWLTSFAVGHGPALRWASVTVACIVALLVVSAVVAACAAALRGSRASRGARSERTRPTAPQTSADLRMQALRAADAGAYRDAAALLVRAVARALDERGRLADDSARTPFETARALHDRAYDAFADAAAFVLYAGDGGDAVAWSRLADRSAVLFP